jgi:hypothetical protein
MTTAKREPRDYVTGKNFYSLLILMLSNFEI